MHWCRCQVADFRNNGIGVLGVTSITQALKSNDTLSSLLLGTNSIGDEGAELLAQYLAGLCTPVPLQPSLRRCLAWATLEVSGRVSGVLRPKQPYGRLTGQHQTPDYPKRICAPSSLCLGRDPDVKVMPVAN